MSRPWGERDYNDDGDLAEGCASALVIMAVVVVLCYLLAKTAGWL